MFVVGSNVGRIRDVQATGAANVVHDAGVVPFMQPRFVRAADPELLDDFERFLPQLAA